MKKTFAMLPLILVAPSVFAGGKLDYSLGANISYASVHYEDDDGETDTENLVFPVRLFGELKMDKINKFQLGWRQVDFDIDATKQGDMGATFEGDQFDAVWLHQVRLGRDFKPWFGIGVRVSMIDVTGKHLIDQEGFLMQRFDPVSDTVMAGLAEAYYEFPIGRSGWYLDANATYEMPVSGDGLSGFGAGAGIKIEF